MKTETVNSQRTAEPPIQERAARPRLVRARVVGEMLADYQDVKCLDREKFAALLKKYGACAKVTRAARAEAREVLSQPKRPKSRGR